MAPKNRRHGGAILAAVCALGLSSCATADYGNGTTGSLTAIGSASQNGPIAAWLKGWAKENPPTSLRFSPDGDAVGRDAMVRGMAHFASLDSQLTREDWESSKTACGPEGAFAVPTSVTPIGVAYNVSSLRNVNLDASTLSAIFHGDITRWNDKRISELNPDTKLPDMKIVPVWARAESGLAQAVGRYLSPNDGAAAGIATQTWANASAGQSVATYADIAKKVDDTAGSITFMDRSSIGSRFSTAALRFGDEFVKFTEDAFTTAVANAKVSEAVGGGVDMSLQVGASPGYSLAFVGYQAFCHSYQNPALARLVKSWASYVTGGGGQANSTYFAQVMSPNSKALELSSSAVETIKASQDDNH
ncbi:substrate-binding domain-containing protein [Pseudarthrobacter sp. PH31-O2]|uniref:substrate-binding domain-containing protein n=1 Tax=Pseudarthrobacter sp. PH31-O2 TaxID=3046206 RepID=UPI0024BA864C|nr:substrate-binding domain-containing protein [Pseudarthrobacter sp. PH31-O2]MDJ0351177.1 substrate-binding domain-containing protein [Pseudarthrobacter sp. PH31-O2]